ncbi:MAG TPA: NIPSNAP family protein [Vicinamibacterales bacterium]|nr:NIPSNAP family protein [Vicinamibacterales bacterium]
MDRRAFLNASLAAGGGLLYSSSPAAGDQGTMQTGPGVREYYEWRRYLLRTGPMVARMHEYLEHVSLPALNRAGVKPVGVFTPQFGSEGPSICLLLTYPSLADFAALESRLAADETYQKDAASHRDLPATDPAYVRIDSQLMAAFEGLPHIEVPAAAASGKPRVFELRTYESHSKKASRKKLEMFGKGGELAIFRRTGLTPVFFGENLIGRRLPSFTYMLVYDDLAAREANWATFIGDPEWEKLRTTPGYEDAKIVSNITALILRPTRYSQI